MPVYLRKDSIRLFEASVEFLTVALVSLGLPHIKEVRVEETRYAPVIGLIGASVELAISALYVQASGHKSIMTKELTFKPAGQIMSEFIDILNSPTPQLSFITAGVPEPHKHREQVVSAIRAMKLVAIARAGGLHSGRGPNSVNRL
ncbi:hypothetical protein KOM00_20360 [Geomonas sp. Red69]|uniref:hypothetical protein n=1 Tax=Geomonas diazotrophica TaxID=2843197 RepID=UPI001C10DBC0|nr:hypothetical protein [Geomonas diazotrophica]MBU5639079.1 hypothetical protein [Geomonas diazotrophica]